MPHPHELEEQEFAACPADRFDGFDRGDLDNPDAYNYDDGDLDPDSAYSADDEQSGRYGCESCDGRCRCDEIRF